MIHFNRSTKHRKMSINAKLKVMTMSIFFPMILMVIYLLHTQISTINAYNQVTNSVSYANTYVREFKERMDYSMYLAVVASKSLEELGEGEQTVNGIVTVNPYAYIDEMENACVKMSDIATVDVNKSKIFRLQKSLENLRKCVEEIDANIQQTGNYDLDVELLSKNIYTFTTVIQSGIQEYLYNEINNFSKVRNELIEQNKIVVRICIIISALIAVLSFVISMIASNSVTKPIKRLCVMTRKVGKGDFTTQTQSESGDEVAVLTNSFNHMTAQIGRLIDDIRVEQENLHYAETRLLQEQINPHFLYNTLDTIVWLAEEEKKEEVVSMVTSLSTFFRTTLSEGRDCVLVREEKEHIRSYLEIQRFRYQDILNYELSIDPEIYNYEIPKLTLQPLVENALYHGIKNKRAIGLITIKGLQKQDQLIFQVIDDGIGMEEEELNTLKENMNRKNGSGSKSFGLWNVNKRIQQYYGKNCGVFLESEKGKGTVATIVLSKYMPEPKDRYLTNKN